MNVVMPARNEVTSIGLALAMLNRIPSAQVTVVDNGSDDRTGERASEFGVTLLEEPRAGKGFAVVAGLKSVRSERVFLCDADISGVTQGLLNELEQLAVSTDAPIVRFALGREPETSPVTTFTALPMLRAFGFLSIQEPLGGLAIVSRQFVLNQHLPGGWGFDVALTIHALSSFGTIPELVVKGVAHRQRPLREYQGMANDVSLAIFGAVGIKDWDHSDCTLCSV
jgi:glycosyltransferase involved in cell wall biosynthesis